MISTQRIAKPAASRSHPKYPFATMKVGECFFIKGKTLKYVSKYASQRGSELGRVFSVRDVTGTLSKTKIGVWRDK